MKERKQQQKKKKKTCDLDVDECNRHNEKKVSEIAWPSNHFVFSTGWVWIESFKGWQDQDFVIYLRCGVQSAWVNFNGDWSRRLSPQSHTSTSLAFSTTSREESTSLQVFNWPDPRTLVLDYHLWISCGSIRFIFLQVIQRLISFVQDPRHPVIIPHRYTLIVGTYSRTHETPKAFTPKVRLSILFRSKYRLWLIANLYHV